MKYIRLFITIVCLGSFTAFAQGPQDIFEKYRDNVCLVEYYKNISSQTKIGSYMKLKQKRIGLIASADGLIIVNSDVFPISLDILSMDVGSFRSGEPSDFKVKLHDGREYKAEFIGKDDVAQMAFIQITDAIESPLPFVKFDDTSNIRVGQPVYLLELLGEGYEYEPLFTSYTINAVIKSPRRKFLIKNDINALSAGGLVITAEGAAVGITLRNGYNMDFSEHGEFDDFRRDFLEIAPTENFQGLIEDPPIFQKSAHRGKAWLGIGMQALTNGLKEFWEVPAEGGIIIDRIYPESPAGKAGLKVKDVLIEFDGQAINVTRDEELRRFRELITNSKPGAVIELSVFRDGKIKKEKVTLGSAPRSIDLAEKYQSAKLGLEVRELTWDILYEYDLPLKTTGVYVFQVDRASPAGLGGLDVGSIITHIDGKAVKGLADFEQKISEAVENGNNKIMFQLRYRRVTSFVFIDAK